MMNWNLKLRLGKNICKFDILIMNREVVTGSLDLRVKTNNNVLISNNAIKILIYNVKRC